MSIAAVLLFAAAAAVPRVELSVSPANIVVTESAQAEIRIRSKQQIPGHLSIAADFIPENMKLRAETSRIKEAGGAADSWLYVVRVPVAGDKPGKRILGPVTLSIPVREGLFGFASRVLQYKSGTARLEVIAPPEAGRPASYCGAISDGVRVKAMLDSNVCTAGDPVLVTLEISGANDNSMVRAPDVPSALKDSPFKIDSASLKTETLAASKRFTWRARAMKAGTVELPPLEVAWFDTVSRKYRTERTNPLPVQIKAGAQAVLAALDEVGGETDEYPLPDGIELPFAPENFTLKHAVSAAVNAASDAEFLSAAELYRSYIESLESRAADDAPDGIRHLAVHWSNAGSLYAMAGKPREALDAYSRAERISGETPSTLRGIRAARARLLGDPKAELPLQRLLFPFWYRLSMKGRIACAAACLAAMVLLFAAALRAGRGMPVLVAALACVPLSSGAWPFGDDDPFENFFGRGFPRMEMISRPGMSPVGAKAWFGSTSVYAGEPVELVATIDPGTVQIDPDSVGIKVASSGDILGAGVDSTLTRKIRMVFREPGTNFAEVAVSGAFSGSYCVTNGNSIASGSVMNQSFDVRTKKAMIEVKPLPGKSMPPDFSGAVGGKFKIGQTLSPESVHPGDLVTAEYRLEFDGWCPSNVLPRVENLSREFKAYDVKEVSREPGCIVWRQMLVPRTADATNSALVSIGYFNPRTGCYARALARPAKLSFLSSEAASTENIPVMVDEAGDASKSAGGRAPVVLRFAPGAKSPVVATVPAGTDSRETGRFNGWRRLETPRGSGWTR